MDVLGGFVGQFWRPHRLSQRRYRKVFNRLIKQFDGKPRMRIHDNQSAGLFLFMWREG